MRNATLPVLLLLASLVVLHAEKATPTHARPRSAVTAPRLRRAAPAANPNPNPNTNPNPNPTAPALPLRLRGGSGGLSFTGASPFVLVCASFAALDALLLGYDVSAARCEPSAL